MATSSSAGFAIDPSGGAGYRKLRDEEKERLKQRLNEICEQETRISPQDIDIRKDIVNWLLKLLQSEFRPHKILYKMYRAGSAYERLQAGEASDFDVMVYMNVWRGRWRVQNEEEHPGFCSIKWLGVKKLKPKTDATPAAKTSKDEKPKKRARKEKVFLQLLLDDDDYLSSLKVRKFFTSQTDKILRKKSPLMFTHKNSEQQKTTTEKKLFSSKSEDGEKSVEIKVTRVHRGPSTTLMIECPALDIAPFSLDIVNSLHQKHVRLQSSDQGDRGLEECDFVAKPINKQKMFSEGSGRLWRKSYSRSEVAKLRKIDQGNQIHRKVLRIFKIVKANQSQLKLLKTYIYKNILMFLSDLPGSTWTDNDIADRFVDMVIALRNCLTAESLPVYFNKNVNLLSEYKSCQLERIVGFLKRVANKGIDGYMELLSMKEREHHQKPLVRKRRRRKNPQQKSKKEKQKKTEIAIDAKKLTKEERRKKWEEEQAMKKSRLNELDDSLSSCRSDSDTMVDFDDHVDGYTYEGSLDFDDTDCSSDDNMSGFERFDNFDAFDNSNAFDYSPEMNDPVSDYDFSSDYSD